MCDVCAVLRKHYRNDPQLHRMHCPACAHCGARLIQKIQRWSQLPRPQVQAACRQVLADWLACGHCESEIRALAKAGAWAVASAPAQG